MWTRLRSDVEVPATEWLAEWNVPPTERRSSRPFCSVHWEEHVKKGLLPGDKVFQREAQSSYDKKLVFLLERNGRVIAVSEQVLWKAIE
jgi:hypothetical protein